MKNFFLLLLLLLIFVINISSVNAFLDQRTNTMLITSSISGGGGNSTLWKNSTGVIENVDNLPVLVDNINITGDIYLDSLSGGIKGKFDIINILNDVNLNNYDIANIDVFTANNLITTGISTVGGLISNGEINTGVESNFWIGSANILSAVFSINGTTGIANGTKNFTHDKYVGSYSGFCLPNEINGLVDDCRQQWGFIEGDFTASQEIRGDTICNDDGLCLNNVTDNVNPIWTNVSHTATYYNDVNITENLSVKNIGLLGYTPNYPIHYEGEPGINRLISFEYGHGSSAASPFYYDVYIPQTVVTGTQIMAITNARIFSERTSAGSQYLYGNFIKLGGAFGVRHLTGSQYYTFDDVDIITPNGAFGVTTASNQEFKGHDYNLGHGMSLASSTGNEYMSGGYTNYATKANNIMGGSRTYETYGYHAKGFEGCQSYDTCYAFYAENGNSYFDGDVTIADDFLLENTVEEDIRFPASVIKVAGASNIPGWDSTNFGYDFSSSTMEQAFFTAQMPHARKAGTNIKPHFHWQTSNNNAGNVVWCIEYSWANIDGSFPSTTTQCVTDSSQRDSTKHLMTSEIIISGTGKTYSSQLKGRIYRDATNAADTYGSDALLLEFDIHYYLDKLGD